MSLTLRFLTRYLWSALLLLAALLSSDVASTITLIVAAVLYTLFVALREQRLGRLMAELAALLSLDTKPKAPPKQITTTVLERSLGRLQRQLLTAVIGAELVVFITMLLGGGDAVTARNYAVLVLVALAPIGLEAEIAVLLHSQHHRASETVHTAIDYAAEDARTLLAILGLSFIGTIWLHIPAALSTLEILVITCIVRPLLSGRALQLTPHKATQPWRTLFAAVTIYGSFLFFFIRHYFSPRYLDVQNPITWRATTVTLAAFVACQAALILLNPHAPKHIARKAISLLIAMLVVLYLPFTHGYFMTHGLSAVDWFCVIVAGLFYVSLCLLQRFSSTHSRRSVVALHKTTVSKQ